MKILCALPFTITLWKHRKVYLFHKNNRKRFPFVCIEFTHESLGELEIAVEHARLRLVFPQHFSFSQTSLELPLMKLWKHRKRFLLNVYFPSINTNTYWKVFIQ